MRKNSKCAIYSLERIEKENFKPFWKATLVDIKNNLKWSEC